MATLDTPVHRTLAQLRAALDDIRQSPRNVGRLDLIVRRPQVGEREVLEEGWLTEAEGLAGDSWCQRSSSRSADGSPHPDMQLTLMSTRAIAAITPDEDRWPLAGDQMFVDLDLTEEHLPPGTRLHIGDAIVVVTTQPHTGCGKFVERFGVDAMKWVNSAEGRHLHLRGIYVRVVQEGRIRRGDHITVRR
ncbi:MAG TPA: MOSC domain-containing protein [Luteitalea sp.]|nr:MOSC domain-containing protein [Luteitalea sp.]